MNKEISIHEFESNFNNYLNKVENGETFVITDDKGRSVIMKPADEEIIRVHTEHNDAC